MNKPFWFNIIEQWKKMGKGSYGVSFPFLVGAISHSASDDIDRQYIEDIFTEIESNPVKGFYCEVRWCGNIDEPVVSTKPLSDLKVVSIKGKLDGNKQVSFGFTEDLMGMFGLDCKTANECREKLIDRTLQYVEGGNFSKNHGKFTPFSNPDIAFIMKVAKLSNKK